MQPERKALLSDVRKAQAAKGASVRAVEPATPMGAKDLDGAEVLDRVRSLIGKYCVMPTPAALDAVTLWAAHTWLAAEFDTSPRLVVSAPEKQCGKTRLLEVLQLLCRESDLFESPTPAVTFRLVDKGHEDGRIPTILIDECDALFSGAKSDPDAQDLRGLLNHGFRAGKVIPRCVGQNHQIKRFNCYAPVALAGIRDCVPDTIKDRAVRVRMRKRAPDETVAGFRLRDSEEEAAPIREALEAWAAGIANRVYGHRPSLPEGVADRPADVWEPLLTVAELAGGEWPKTAKAACVEFVGASQDADEQSLGVQLLAAVRDLLTEAKAMSTVDLVAKLNADDELPFGALRGGNGIDSRWLGKVFRSFDKMIRTKSVRPPGSADTCSGYHIDQFADVFARYLPPLEQDEEDPFAADEPAPVNGKPKPEQVVLLSSEDFAEELL